MHAKDTANNTLVLEQLPNGESAWLRPIVTIGVDRYRLNPERVVIVDQVAEPKFTPRDQLPRFVVQTQTVYVVYAETADRALRWFADQSDTDLDVEPFDFGQVEVLGQLRPESESDEDPRYWLTEQGRRALAMASLFGTVAEVVS